MIVDIVSNIDETTIGLLRAGPKGLQGDKGWSPILAVADDDDRIVLQVVDWSGGAGTKPATGLYVGSAGLVVDIEDAESFPGVIGPNISVDGTPMVADGVSGSRIKNITYAAFKALLELVKGDVGLGNVPNLDTSTQTNVSFTGLSAAAAVSDADTLPVNQGAGNLKQTFGAIKTWVNGIIATYVAAQDVEVFKGAIDCSANPNYPAADAGHVYRVSVAGKIGGGSGVNVEVNDRLECLVDSSAAGNHATVGSNWMISQANVDGAVIGPASVTDNRIAQFDGTSGKLLEDSGKHVTDFATSTQGGKADTALQGVTAGTNISIDNTDPIHPVISATAGAPDIAGAIHAATAKPTPVDDDEFGIADSASSYVLKRSTWANLKATLLAVFGSDGIVARTAAGTFAARAVTGTTGQITVANGNGVSGDPTLSLPADVLIPTILTVPNTGLHLLDTNASHDLIIRPGSNITADRTLTLTTGDADRTLTLNSDVNISSFIATLLDDANEAAARATIGAVLPGMVLLAQSGVVSNAATVDFTTGFSSDYDEYVFLLRGLSPVTNATALRIGISSNAGSTWAITANVRGAIVLGSTATASAGSQANITPAISNSSDSGAFGSVRVIKGGSSRTYVNSHLFADANDSGVNAGMVSAMRFNAGTVNGVQFFAASGNVDVDNNILMYGVKNS